MSVRMRHTKGHTRNRRAHHSLKSPRLSECVECKATHLRHRICENCGKYRGRIVVDTEAALLKKAARIQRKNKALGIEDKAEVKEKS